jgi:hypothetical protein
VLPRNSLEWRCDPACQWRHPAITRRDLRIILVCEQGYQSSLAAANLQMLGLSYATDLDGGFTAWAAAGLSVITPGHSQPNPPGDHYPEGPERHGNSHRVLAGRPGPPAHHRPDRRARRGTRTDRGDLMDVDAALQSQIRNIEATYGKPARPLVRGHRRVGADQAQPGRGDAQG